MSQINLSSLGARPEQTLMGRIELSLLFSSYNFFTSSAYEIYIFNGMVICLVSWRIKLHWQTAKCDDIHFYTSLYIFINN